MKKTKRYKGAIEDLFGRWIGRFGLEHWDIDIEYRQYMGDLAELAG